MEANDIDISNELIPVFVYFYEHFDCNRVRFVFCDVTALSRLCAVNMKTLAVFSVILNQYNTWST